MFLSTPADIAIYGGAAGSGKSFAMLLEPLRHVTTNPGFGAVIFRRNAVQVKNQGGLWDESLKLYPQAEGRPVSHTMEWKWESGGAVKFAHLEHETTVFNWQGAQIPLIGFDELTHFSESQFFYMLSRNRSMCGVRPYVRASTNPDVESWVATFIAWWIDQETGFPIQERAGQIRWFVRVNDELKWADDPDELISEYGDDFKPKSVTFIPAKITDNQKLMEADPGYMANLLALDQVSRERLLEGNWLVRQRIDGMFLKSWLKFAEIRPATLNIYITVDPASSKKKTSDNTAMAVTGVDAAKNKYLLDGYCHKMNLHERWLALLGLRKKWMDAPGVQGVFVGYEKYGMQSDIEHFESEMERIGVHFPIKELNWAMGLTTQSKPDRVQRLVPDFIKGKYFLIAAVTKEKDGKRVLTESAAQRKMQDQGEGYRVLKPVKKRDHTGAAYALNAKFLNEYLNFPSPNFPDDMVDACSRIYDMEYNAPVIIDEQNLEPEVA